MATKEMKRRANKILDDIREGIHHSAKAVNWALRVLGEVSA